jgi:glycerol uptake facilitator-like aquaporin
MIIVVFAPVSGAHFNPAVTLADAAIGQRSWRTVPGGPTWPRARWRPT